MGRNRNNRILRNRKIRPASLAKKLPRNSDDRHLWPAMFGIIRTSRPTWILAENVAGHVTLGLDQVLADLESEDYAVQPIIVPACAVDAPHRRDRVWILANAKSDRLQGRTQSKDGERYFEQDGTTDKPSGTSSGDPSRIMGNAEKRSGNERSRGCNENRELQISELGNASREIAFADSDNARRVKQWRSKSIQSELIAAECGNRWSAEPNVGRVANGIPRRVDRLRGLGNAIVPQVAYEIIKAMIEADESA
jgi:DNA (cytosine-5)-methyltransferase 1